MFGAGGLYAFIPSHLPASLVVLGLGAAYWFTNQKWAYLSAGIAALVVASAGRAPVLQCGIQRLRDPQQSAAFSDAALVSIGLGAVRRHSCSWSSRAGAVAPVNNPNAFGGAFAGVHR